MARREIQLRAKTRVFVVTTAILLIAVALAVSLPAILAAKNKPDRIGVVGDTTTISGIVTEAGRLAGGQAVAVPQPSLAAAEAALRSGDLSAVLVPNSEIIVKQVPLAGVTGSVATLAQLAGLSKLIQTVPGAASAVAHGVTLPVRGLEAPTTSLSSRLTGLFTVIIVWILISVYGSQIALGIGEEKSSRVVEVLLSTVRPVQLLIGKVLGIGLLALSQAAGMVAVFMIAGFASGSSLVHGAVARRCHHGRGVHHPWLRVLLHGVRRGRLAGVAAVGRELDDPAGAAPADHHLRAVLHGGLRQRGEQVLPRARLPAADRADRDAGALRGGRRPGLAGRWSRRC